MFAWIGSISNIFGYVLNYIYELVGNYGIAILLFSLLAKLITIPLTYFQQKGMKKTALISEEVQKIQEKYKGNDKKIQEETMKVYEKNNTSPFASCSSCFTLIFQMILVFAMFYLVNEPLTYMRKIDKDLYQQYEIRMYEEVIAEKEAGQELEAEDKEENKEKKEQNEEEFKEESKEEQEENKEQNIEEKIKELRAKSGITRPQMEMISRFRDENEVFNINTEFLGLNLTEIPTNSLKKFNIKDKDTYIVLANFILPLLYMGVSILNTIQQKKQLQKKSEEKQNSNLIVLNEEQKNKENLPEKEEDKLNAQDVGDAMQDANKSMMYFLPIVMFTVTMSAPLSLALYWLASTVLSSLEKIIVDKIVNKEEKETDIDTKKAIKVKK